MDYALIVGIEQFKYNHPIINFVENDISEFKKVMIECFSLKEDNIILLFNDQASFLSIQKAIETISNKGSDGDRIFVYFATHGNTVYETPYLACYDSEKGDNKNINNWLSATRMIAMFSMKKFNILVFLDCCQSNYMFTSRGIIQDVFEYEINQHAGNYVGVFAAAGMNEDAHSDSEYYHGCWTYYLLEALQGKNERAFKQNTKKITQSSLQEFLKKSVTKRIKENLGETQTPYFWGSFSNEITIIEYLREEGVHMKIKDIYFGEIDTDSEIKSAPSKEYFTQNYFDLNSMSSIFSSNNNVQIIAGNKGTGKTYLGEYLAVQTEDNLYYNIGSVTVSDISNITNNKENDKGKYKQSWKYILLTAFIIYSIKEKLKNYEEFEKILSGIYGGRSAQLYTNKKLRISIICDKKIKSGIRLIGNYSNYADSSGITTMPDLVSLYEDRLNKTYKDGKMIFFVDGIDEQIRDHIKEKLRYILLDLLGAVEELNDALNNIKIVLLIRRDVLRMLDGESNLNKVLEARTKDLTWLNITSDFQLSPLYQLINKRIQTSFKEHNFVGEPKTLLEIIPEQMQKQSTWEWILELTTHTPRDIVSFFIECQKVTTSEQTIFTEANLWDAVRPYGNYLWREFSDALSGTILSNCNHDLLSILEEIGANHSIKSGNIKFTYSDYLTVFNKCEGLKSLNVNDVLKQLYESGIIGVQTGSKNTYWFYREDPIKFNSESFKEYTFEIHKGLWKIVHMW